MGPHWKLDFFFAVILCHGPVPTVFKMAGVYNLEISNKIYAVLGVILHKTFIKIVFDISNIDTSPDMTSEKSGF